MLASAMGGMGASARKVQVTNSSDLLELCVNHRNNHFNDTYCYELPQWDIHRRLDAPCDNPANTQSAFPVLSALSNNEREQANENCASDKSTLKAISRGHDTSKLETSESTECNNAPKQRIPNNSLSSRFQSIEIHVSNVVSAFSTGCRLDLRQLATRGINVVYRRSSGKVVMSRRYPLRGMANIYASGRISCFGCKSEMDAYRLGRQMASSLKKAGFKRIRFCDFRVVNIFSHCKLPFTLNLPKLITEYRRQAKANKGSQPYGISYAFYEPELHPGATIKIKELKVTLKLFSTGSMTVIGPDCEALGSACRLLYPILLQST